MARPRKCRKVCSLPQNSGFRPIGDSNMQEPIVMAVDEYEAIRLIDHEGFSQEECGAYMKVARTTAQQIYNEARRKLAEALVHGVPLTIRGGDYHICDGAEENCNCGGCQRHRCRSFRWADQEAGQAK